MNRSLLSNRSLRISEIHQRLYSTLFLLEQKRLDIKKRKRAFYISLLIGIAIIGIFYNYLLIFSVFIFIVYAIFYYVYISKHHTKLTESFNKKVVPVIIEEFFPEATFQIDSCIDSSEYWSSKLFNKSVDRYNGSKLFVGRFGETDIQFSHLHTEYKTETRNKNGTKNTSWHTIFKGTFMIADSNKTFKGETIVLPDTAEQLLGGFGKWIQEKIGSSKRGELVYLENPTFEKKFVVYSTDPVEARYLLTPSMQQYFVELAEHMGNKSVNISFIEGKVYLGLVSNIDLFDIKVNKSFNDVATIEYYTKDLLHILSVIEILDLNTRIWGK